MPTVYVARRDDRADHPAVRTEIANLDTRLSTETAGVRTEIASLETSTDRRGRP